MLDSQMYYLSFANCCDYLSFQISHETVDWKTSSSSAFYLSAEKSLVKTEEELLAFDFEDLVNGLGGALGLFLGWSLLHIFGEIFKLLQQIRGWVLGGWAFLFQTFGRYF